MRLLGKRKSLRVGAAGLAMSVVAVLVSALPAYAVQPTVSAVNPTSGLRGSSITITGTEFQNPAVTSVTIGGASASFSIGGPTTITATVPCAAPAGLVDVIVNNGAASSNTAADNFTVNAATAPTISSFTPTSGTAGTTSVVITGTNLCGASIVRFNATNATIFTVNSGTQITATVPTGATSGKLTVTTSAGSFVSTADFIVGPPVISSFSPTIGPVGTAVTISGSNFNGVNSVRFNGTAATFTVTSSASISTTVPTGATTGVITVVNSVGTATGAIFTVGEPSHGRSVSFTFDKNSRVSGQVTVGDNFAACYRFVPVAIQKQSGGGWKWVDTTSTTDSGSFKTYIPPSSGTFRVKVNKLTLMNGSVCLSDTSPGRHHNA